MRLCERKNPLEPRPPSPSSPSPSAVRRRLPRIAPKTEHARRNSAKFMVQSRELKRSPLGARGALWNIDITVRSACLPACLPACPKGAFQSPLYLYLAFIVIVIALCLLSPGACASVQVEPLSLSVRMAPPIVSTLVFTSEGSRVTVLAFARASVERLPSSPRARPPSVVVVEAAVTTPSRSLPPPRRLRLERGKIIAHAVGGGGNDSPSPSFAAEKRNTKTSLGTNGCGVGREKGTICTVINVDMIIKTSLATVQAKHGFLPHYTQTCKLSCVLECIDIDNLARSRVSIGRAEPECGEGEEKRRTFGSSHLITMAKTTDLEKRKCGKGRQSSIIWVTSRMWIKSIAERRMARMR